MCSNRTRSPSKLANRVSNMYADNKGKASLLQDNAREIPWLGLKILYKLSPIRVSRFCLRAHSSCFRNLLSFLFLAHFLYITDFYYLLSTQKCLRALQGKKKKNNSPSLGSKEHMNFLETQIYL